MTQTAGSCSYTITPTSDAYTAAGGTGSITVTPSIAGCTTAWTATESVGWITITAGGSGSGAGRVDYRVSANSGAERSATITVAGQAHRVTQTAATCTFSITPTSSGTIAVGGGSYTVNVDAAHEACTWNTAESIGWISLSPRSGTGDGAVTVTVDPNSGAARSANITVAGQTHTVRQAGALPDYTFTALSLDTSSVTAGGTVNVSYTAVNQGGASGQCINMGIYLSTDNRITTGDTLLRRWGLPTSICPVDAGRSWSQTWAVTIPAATAPGAYYVGMIVDPDNLDSESNERNNTGARALTVSVTAGPPSISAISHEYTGLYDQCINSSGNYFEGHTYTIRFNYTDPDGDVTADDGAFATVDGFNFHLGSFLVGQSGNGFSGTLALYYCNSNAYATVRVTLTDGAGRTSNRLTRSLSP